MDDRKYFSRRQLERNQDVKSIGLGFQSQQRGEVVGQVYVPGKRAANPYGPAFHQQDQAQRPPMRSSYPNSAGFSTYESNAYQSRAQPQTSFNQRQCQTNVSPFGIGGLIPSYGVPNPPYPFRVPSQNFQLQPDAQVFVPQAQPPLGQRTDVEQNYLPSPRNQNASQPKNRESQTDYYHQHSKTFGTLEKQEGDGPVIGNTELKTILQHSEPEESTRKDKFLKRVNKANKSKSDRSSGILGKPSGISVDVKEKNETYNNKQTRKTHPPQSGGKQQHPERRNNGKKERDRKNAGQPDRTSDENHTQGKEESGKERNNRSNRQKNVESTPRKGVNSEAFQSSEVASKAEQIRQQLIQTSLKASSTDKESSKQKSASKPTVNLNRSLNYPFGKNKGNRQQDQRQDTGSAVGNSNASFQYKSDVKLKKWNKDKVLQKYAPIDSEHAQTLIEKLIEGTYECMVCCDRVRWSNATWNCQNCFHVFHLFCIRKWGNSASALVKGG